MLLGWGRASLGWHRGTAWAGADKSQWVDGSSLGWWSGMSGAGRGEQSESLSAWQAGQEQGSFPAPGSLSCLLPAPHGHCTMCSFVERRKRFFWSGSLACQQNRIHGRPVPSTPFSSCPSHIISKNWKSRGEPRGGLQNLHSQLGRTGEGGREVVPAFPGVPPGHAAELGTRRGCSLPAGCPAEPWKTPKSLGAR